MKTRILLVLAFFFMLLFIMCSSGEQELGYTRTFYVSPDGNDANSGKSMEKAWKTIARVNENNLAPGDRVLFSGGSSYSGTIELNSMDSGNATLPITLASYGNGSALIDGGNGLALKAENCSYLTLENLKFSGSGRKDGNQSDGLFISGCEHVVIDSVEVSGFQHSGISVYQCKDIIITHVYAHDNGFAGIHVFGTTIWDKDKYDNSGIYIAYCVAENNPGDPTATDNHSGNGILASSVKNGTIEYCEAFNNGWDMPWHGNGPVGIWIWDCTDFTIQYCISHDNKTSAGAADGGGFDLDGGVSNSVIQYCLSYNNQGAGIGLFEFGAGKVWENNIVRYNISQNDGTNGTASVNIWKGEAGGTIRNCEIFNNTFYNNAGPNLCFMNNWSGFNFRNNIFIYRGSLLVKGQKIQDEVFSHNLYWNLDGQPRFLGYPDLEKWARAKGKEISGGKFTGIYADPILKNPGTLQLTDPMQMQRKNLMSYSPLSGSPVINAGWDIASQTACDVGAVSSP